MSSTIKPLPAEAADRRWHVFAFLMLALAIKCVFSAAKLMAADPYLLYVRWAEGVSAVVVVLLALRLVTIKFRAVAPGKRRALFDMEGYVKETIRRAFQASWSATLLTLMAFTVVFDEPGLKVPVEFFLQVALAVMLSVFGIAFFVLNRSDDEDTAGA